MQDEQCPICGELVDVAKPHDYDREARRPVHRECADSRSLEMESYRGKKEAA